MRFSSRDAMAKRYHSGQPFTASYFKCTSCFSVCQGGPAGVQAKLLSFQHEPLPVIAACFLQAAAFFAHQSDVVLNTGKAAVMRQKAVKGPGLVHYQLDMQAAFPVAVLYFPDEALLCQPCSRVRVYIGVHCAAASLPEKYPCFFSFSISYSSVSGWGGCLIITLACCSICSRASISPQSE